ncbi:MAG TPA: alpha/beta hydrolase [Candidatus Sulfotelmatobacter sp.]|nr:alpha/beta hydrolase [Candidatus Sulfotelmatobacter sp.]
MQRRSALKSMFLALGSGSFAFAAKRPSGAGSVTAAPPSSAAQSSLIETRDKTRIHFRDWGGGRPIVFVAPWGLCSDWWDIPVINFFERGWRCVSFDRRGHARSDDPSHGYDFDTLADDIAAVLDALDLQDVVLVGHSLGGAEVVRYLTRHRSRRVKHAVLIAPTTPFRLKTDDNPRGTPRETIEKNRESLKHDLPRLAAQAAPDFFGVPKNSVSTETMDWWCRMFLDRCSIKVLLELFKLMNETDFRSELPTIQTPMLILQGDIDKSAPLELTGRPTHELVAGSRLIVYENAAHGLPYTHTDRMLEDIIAFAGA